MKRLVDELFLVHPFSGAHLSFPELIISLASSGNARMKRKIPSGIRAFPGLGKPNVLGQAMGGGCLGKEVILESRFGALTLGCTTLWGSNIQVRVHLTPYCSQNRVGSGPLDSPRPAAFIVAEDKKENTFSAQGPGGLEG